MRKNLIKSGGPRGVPSSIVKILWQCSILYYRTGLLKLLNSVAPLEKFTDIKVSQKYPIFIANLFCYCSLCGAYVGRVVAVHITFLLCRCLGIIHSQYETPTECLKQLPSSRAIMAQ